MVKPLVVEVEVIQDAPTFWKKELGRHKVENELEGKTENVYNYGIFLYTEDTKSDMIVAATNEALRKASETMEQKMGGVTSGLGLPAGFGF